MHVLLTRPYAKSLETKRQLEEIGCRVSIEPVLDISPVRHSSDIYKNSKGLIVTSFHASAQILQQKDKIDKNTAIFAVGEATARPLHKAGFKNVYEASGDAKSLLPVIRDNYRPEDGLITYLSGWHITQDLAKALAMEGFKAQRVVIYKANLINDLSSLIKAEILRKEIDCVILMSNRSAHQFCKMCHEAKIVKHLNRIVALTMSEDIVKNIEGIRWKDIKVAQEPSMHSIIDKLRSIKRKISLEKFNRMKRLQSQEN